MTAVWSSIVPYGPVWSCPYFPQWSHMVLYGPKCSRMVLYGPVWPRLVPYGHVCSLMLLYAPVCSRLVLYEANNDQIFSKHAEEIFTLFNLMHLCKNFVLV